MIELHAIRKAFNQGHDNEYWALDGIDLSIEANKVTALRGPSGSGKTTLLTIVGCLARPTEGRVRLEGEDISGLPERFLTENPPQALRLHLPAVQPDQGPHGAGQHHPAGLSHRAAAP
jgi:ABC-type lipoprotein export system ATPase subunit